MRLRLLAKRILLGFGVILRSVESIVGALVPIFIHIVSYFYSPPIFPTGEIRFLVLISICRMSPLYLYI
jgi:hypothetical protein